VCGGDRRIDIRLRQRLDLDMWTRLVKRRSLYVTSDVLVFLRWHGKNISNTNPVDAHSRWLNEHFLMAESFFDGVSKGLFVEAFGDLLVHADPPAEEYCDIEKALLHLRCRSSVGALNAVVGLRRLHELLGSPRHRAILAGDYGIDHVVFHRLSGETGTFHQALQPPAGGRGGGTPHRARAHGRGAWRAARRAARLPLVARAGAPAARRTPDRVAMAPRRSVKR
jgi:hypothetical protein